MLLAGNELASDSLTPHFLLSQAQLQKRSSAEGKGLCEARLEVVAELPHSLLLSPCHSRGPSEAGWMDTAVSQSTGGQRDAYGCMYHYMP